MLEATGAPRGSIYHHFPEGKDQLVDAALDLVAQRMLDGLERQRGRSAEDVTGYVIGAWRFVLERSGSRGRLRGARRHRRRRLARLLRHAAAFPGLAGRLSQLYVQAGLGARRGRFAASVIAATEGAVVMCRAEQSLEPLELVAAEMTARVEALLTA